MGKQLHILSGLFAKNHLPTFFSSFSNFYSLSFEIYFFAACWQWDSDWHSIFVSETQLRYIIPRANHLSYPIMSWAEKILREASSHLAIPGVNICRVCIRHEDRYGIKKSVEASKGWRCGNITGEANVEGCCNKSKYESVRRCGWSCSKSSSHVLKKRVCFVCTKSRSPKIFISRIFFSNTFFSNSSWVRL